MIKDFPCTCGHSHLERDSRCSERGGEYQTSYTGLSGKQIYFITFLCPCKRYQKDNLKYLELMSDKRS